MRSPETVTKFSGSFLLQVHSEVRSGDTGHTHGVWLDLVQIIWSEGKCNRSLGMSNDMTLSAAGTYSSVAVFFPTINASVIDTRQVISFGNYFAMATNMYFTLDIFNALPHAVDQCLISSSNCNLLKAM